MKQLSVLNPLDHLRLLWWVLVMPQQLIDYRKKFGEKDERRVGKWLVSTLTWLPLLIPSLALGLEWLPHSTDASLEGYLWISAVLVGCWLWIGMNGDLDKEVAGIVTICEMVVVAVVVDVVASGIISNVVASAEATMVAESTDISGETMLYSDDILIIYEKLVFVIHVCIGVLVAATVVVILNMAGDAALGVLLGVLLGVTLNVMFVMVIFMRFDFLMGAVIMSVVMTINVKKSLKTGTTSWLAFLDFPLLIAAHLFLIYFCFFDGWRLFV